MLRTPHNRARAGFTLVELMVAASMCVLGMWLFTWLYKQGLDSFRTAKAQADLMAQERSVMELLRRDLSENHFVDEDRKPNRGRKLSDQLRTLGANYTPPRGGYFETTTPIGTAETPTGDADGFNSWRSNHALRFTVIRPGGLQSNQFTVQTPAASGPQYGGIGAEVAYFLVQRGNTPGGVQLYDLYRHERLVALNDDFALSYNEALRTNTALSDVREVFALTNPIGAPTGTPQVATFGFLSSPANRAFRVPFTQLTTPGRAGDDKVLSNVVSFELKYTGPTGAAWPTRFTATSNNSDYPYDWLPGSIGNRFDSGDRNPAQRLTGVHVRLRVWNPKTQHARQTTIVVDL